MLKISNISQSTAFALAGLILAGLALLPACSRKASPKAGVWAEVDGRPIYRDQVERQYHSQAASGSNASSQAQALTFKLNILDELINNQILVDHASQAGISVAETEVDSKLKELQVAFTADEFQKKLREQGMDLNSLRQEIHENLIINKLINKEITSRIMVTDAEISDFYNHNQASFNVPETQYHLAQIQVTPTLDPQVRNLKNDDAETPAAAERKIQALYARLRSGDDFATVAQQYSEDPRTSVGGGDMGFVPASSLATNPQLKAAVGTLKVGQISGIIQTGTGFHIIKLLAIEAPGQRQLSDPGVQSAIRQNLTNEKEQLLKAAYIEDLRNRTKVANYLAQDIITAAGNPAGIQ
ncbi:MAG: peptidylprolyl isomerase [Terriglobia bacterium]